ncbi:MAG: hypothetical protein C0516_10960 [Gemmatimonas sp.]|nr:hypothetical protein [Gemmatimonas sp.]
MGPPAAPVEDRPPPASTHPSPVSVAIIDDNRLLRRGMVKVLASQPEYRVTCDASGVDEALIGLARNAPRLVLLDVGLADEDSVESCARLTTTIPSSRVIVMGIDAPPEDLAAFIRAGAVGFLMKAATLDEMLETMRRVAGGQDALPSALTHSLFTQIIQDAGRENRAMMEDDVRLTVREREIMSLLGIGLSNKEIAARLYIAVHTVKSHVHNILEKLSLRSRLEIAAYSRGGERQHER